MKEIRQLLPNNEVKTKSLDATGPPWWHVRDPEYQSLECVADFDAMFASAMESRTFAETNSNSNSSRSHFILYLEFEAKSPTMKRVSKGSLCLVDLAGSEDPHKASALDDQRRCSPSEDVEKKKIREQRLREGIAINQSLRVLRKSIPKIRNPISGSGKPTLEGGDEESSTLAKLLGPCLGRESMVLMFVMIHLGADSLVETKATLESGKEARTIVDYYYLLHLLSFLLLLLPLFFALRGVAYLLTRTRLLRSDSPRRRRSRPSAQTQRQRRRTGGKRRR